MRTWSVEQRTGKRENPADLFLGFREEGQEAFSRVALISPVWQPRSYARFVVDACNAAEAGMVKLAGGMKIRGF